MTDDAWLEFQRRCLKPDPDRLGSWTARRIGRPAALRVTRVVASLGMTANHATAAAALTALAAVVALGWGTAWAWLSGSVLLVGWYLLDHIDGQLARLNRTASLDGTTLDYVMHHSVNVLLPAAIGFGLFRQTNHSSWIIVGMAWGWGGLLIGLRHDARYKAFVQRLKLLHGELTVIGGGGGRPEPAKSPRGNLRSVATWCVAKACETHIVMAALVVISFVRLGARDAGLLLAQLYAATMALPAVVSGLFLVIRGANRDEAEQEFSAWYRVPSDAALEFRDGWWHVERKHAATRDELPPADFTSAKVR